MLDKPSYYQKISLNNKTPEEAEKIIKLFEDNLNIANKVASKYYKTKYWDFDESLQIARMGLWKACLIWDPNKYKISTLAYNIISRDFIDYDTIQKKQPGILFNLEDNCVTEDLSLNDVLVDEKADIDLELDQTETMKELNQDILYILDDISDELKVPGGIVKLVYLTYIESQQSNSINTKQLTVLPRSTIKNIISLLQTKLSDIM